MATTHVSIARPDFRPAGHRSLATDLESAVEGAVRFDRQAQALYAADASNYRIPPIGVVIPETIDDVVATMEVCRRHDAPS